MSSLVRHDLTDPRVWGEAIRTAKADAGIRLDKDLARRLSVTDTTVSRWMNGKAAPQTEAEAERYLAVLRGSAAPVESPGYRSGALAVIAHLEQQLAVLRREYETATAQPEAPPVSASAAAERAEILTVTAPATSAGAARRRQKAAQ